MKSIKQRIGAACLVSATFGVASAEVIVSKPPSHADLANRRANAESPVAHLQRSDGTAIPAPPPQKVDRGDLFSRSDVLCFGGLMTIVPKRAIIHTPENLSGRIGLKDGYKLVAWPEFHRRNFAWIEAVEVNRAQAEGREKLPENWAEQFEKRRKVVVAVLAQGPISVLPYVEPEPTSEAPTNTQTP